MHLTPWFFRCIGCRRELAPDRPYYTCPDCGQLLVVERDLARLKARFPSRLKFINRVKPCEPVAHYPLGSGVWFWRDLLLPEFPLAHVLSLHEGNTDLWEPPGWLKRDIGFDRLYIKCEGAAPTGSFKDRGMPVAISDALRLQAQQPALGIRYVICASTGDTSASAARYSAYVRDRLTCVVLIPHGRISPAQLYQAQDAGAIVLALEDSFDGCMRVVQRYCSTHPEAVLVNSKNPLRVVGQESISLEIFRDLGYRAPDWLVIPCGNAGNITAQLNAWCLLHDLGIIECLPRIVVAQTAVASTLVRWLRGGGERYEPGKPEPTIASAMNIQDPVSFPRFRELASRFIVVGYDVDEDAIAETRARFNRAGAGLCPQGAVAADAALQARAEGIIAASDMVVMLATASDLKFVDAGVAYHQREPAASYSNRHRVIPATLGAVEDALAPAMSSASHC